jgi:hypothetical protein
MADLKISQLTALTAIDVNSADVLPIVDTSETTTKKVSAADVAEYVSTTTAITNLVSPKLDATTAASTYATITNVDLKADLSSPTFTGTVSGITKTMVGLGNVDNTADTAKPVSTAQQTALNLKSDLASPTFTGTPAAPTASAGTSTTQVATTAFVMNSSDNDQFVLAAAIFTS